MQQAGTAGLMAKGQQQGQQGGPQQPGQDCLAAGGKDASQGGAQMADMQPRVPSAAAWLVWVRAPRRRPKEMLETADGMADELLGRCYRRSELSYFAAPATA